MRMSKFMRISADADPDAELRYTSIYPAQNLKELRLVETEVLCFIRVPTK